MEIERLDHLVLTVRSVEASCAFYAEVLGMEVVTFAGDRKALRFGRLKINLHEAGREVEPHAANATPGSADLCLITATPLTEVIDLLNRRGIQLLEGPVNRSGALGAIRSIYFSDPDGNLLEISNYCP